MMRIDAHQHFWDYAAHPHDYAWMSEQYASLRRRFGPEDLAPLLGSLAIAGTVAVQARETVIETDYLLGLADRHDFILGVVGWLDLCDPRIEADIEAYAQHDKLKGLRMLIHDRADTEFACSPAHVRGVGFLARHGLAYDLLLKPQHLRAATELVDRLPQQAFVVDHIAKPDIAAGAFEPWSSDIERLAQRPNVFCKLSSLITQADWQHWQPGDFKRYLDHVLAVFGPSRLMMGSDWPVSTVVSDYATTMSLVLDWMSPLSVDEQAAICGQTCAAFYRLRRPSG